MIIYLFICLTIVSIYDIKEQRIPDWVTLCFAMSVFYYGYHSAWIIPIAIYLLTAVIVSAFSASMPFGNGDAKLLAAVGLSFGFEGLWITYIAASLTAAVYAIIRVTLKTKQKKDRIAFGPFIAFGFVIFYLSIYTNLHI